MDSKNISEHSQVEIDSCIKQYQVTFKDIFGITCCKSFKNKEDAVFCKLLYKAQNYPEVKLLRVMTIYEIIG